MAAWHLLLLLFGMVLLPHQHAAAQSGWSVTLYGGQASDVPLMDIVSTDELFSDPELEDSYIVVVAVGKEFATIGKYIAWEVEGQIGKHFGIQDHYEFNAVLIARWLLFPWDKYLDTSFALGQGISHATEIPETEVTALDEQGRTLCCDETDRTLSYLLGEFEFSLPQIPHWSLLARLHHRSTIFGLLVTEEPGSDGASNFIGFGMRYRF